MLLYLVNIDIYMFDVLVYREFIDQKRIVKYLTYSKNTTRSTSCFTFFSILPTMTVHNYNSSLLL